MINHEPTAKMPPAVGPEAKSGESTPATEFSPTNEAGTNSAAECAASFRYAKAIDFLTKYSPAGQWCLTAIPAGGGRTATATFAPSDAAACDKWITKHDAGHNLYFLAADPAYPLDSKATKEDVARVRYCWCDVDPRAGENLATEQQRIRALVTADQLPGGVPAPTIAIFSGGGYQCFWALREPVEVKDNPANLLALESRLKQLVAVLDGDKACAEVSHVMRLPGILNKPNEKKRQRGQQPVVAEVVLWRAERVYNLADFAPAPDQITTTATGAAASPRANLSGTVRRLASIDELPAGVSDKAKVVIMRGHDPDEPNKFGGSRSEWLFFACAEMHRGGCDDDTIFGVITDQKFGISASVLDKGRNIEKYARRQIERAREAVAGDFQTDDKGRNLPTQHNIRLALAKLGVHVSCDLFANRLRLAGLPGYGPTLDDAAVDRLWLLTDAQFGFRPARDLYVRVVEDQARNNAYHPVCDYLDALCWDSTPRLDRWLVTYAGAEDSEYVRAVSAIVLLAAVRRVRQPGCKFDEMLVLESPQGLGKSTALRTLAVREDWFSDDLPLNGDTKRQIEALAGRWIVEAGELKGMRKGDVEALKGFLSRQTDSARLAYGRLAAEFPRQCIIIGTTNSDRYLKDGTGNRRFWPVRVGEMNIPALRRDRDQLWAEAAHREAQGGSIRLDPKLYAVAAEQQEQRRIEDPFVQRLAQVLGDLRGKLRAGDAWAIVGVPPGQQTQEHNGRLGSALRELGWRREKRRFGADPEWCYVRGDGHETNVRVVVIGDESGTPRAAIEPESQESNASAF